MLKAKFVDTYYEKFVNNPDSNDMNNTTDEKNKTIYRTILIKLFRVSLSFLFAFNNFFPLIFKIYYLHDYNT